MFEKFLRTPDCMEVLAWLLNHPTGEYSAAIVGIECNMVDMAKFMAVLSILEGVNIIQTNEMSDEVTIKLKEDESIIQLLIHLKDEFNDSAFRSEQVSPSLAYLHSQKLRNIVDSQIFNELQPEDLIDMCKNYKDLDMSDPKNIDVFNFCSKLEENGDYDEFIEKLEESIKK